MKRFAIKLNGKFYGAGCSGEHGLGDGAGWFEDVNAPEVFKSSEEFCTYFCDYMEDKRGVDMSQAEIVEV